MFKEIRISALEHHEKLDRSGYPNGKGNLSLGANLDYPTLYWSKRTPPGAQVFFHRGGLGLAMEVGDGLE